MYKLFGKVMPEYECVPITNNGQHTYNFTS